MHIGFLVSEYPHKKIDTQCAGIGTATNNIVLGLLQKGHTVSVFIYGQNITEIIEEGSLTIYKIKNISYRFLGFFLYRKKINQFVNKKIKEKRIKILEAPDWTGITAFMKFKVPLIIRLHGSDAYFCHLNKTKQKRKNYFFEKQALKGSSALISVSKYTLDVTRKIFNLKKESIVIPNGLFLNKQLSFFNSTDQNNVLYFGSMVRKKGIFNLAHIFNELIKLNPSAKLTIAGRDVVDKVEGISSLIFFKKLLSKEAFKNFNYIGAVPYSEINKVIEKSNVCVFPSLAESFGMVTIEAMYLKKAIVNTDYPWAKEIMIDGKTGFLENPNNFISFAEKINRFLKDRELMTRMGEQAHKYVIENFSMNQITNDNILFYKKYIANEV